MDKKKRFEDLADLKDLQSLDCVVDLLQCYSEDLEDLKSKTPIYPKEDLILAINVLQAELAFGKSRLLNVIGDTLTSMYTSTESDVRQGDLQDGNK